MRRLPTPPPALVALSLLLFNASCGGGGDDGGTDPIVVTSVLITAPSSPPAFQTLGRTVQFAATARDASEAPVAGATITWQSTNETVADVSSSGLVTAGSNGTATITAHAGGIASTGVLVTVAQVIDTVNPTPAIVAFGAIGSTRQLVAVAVDSSDASVPTAPAVTWSSAGTGTVATVSPTGLATAIGLGNSDTAVATIGTKVARIPISVTQVVASVQVTPTAPETLRTTGRTKQFAAVARDSLGNDIPGAGIIWSSGAPAAFSLDAGTGVATAIADGSGGVIATASGVSGQRPLHVERYAETFTMTPSAASITTNSGAQVFTGNARDSADTVLPIAWQSRNATVLSNSPTSGTQTTATAEGNGQTYLVMSAGTRRDSALVTVSGQVTFPLVANVEVGNFYFKSIANATQNSAVDTIGVGGTVTWTWGAGAFTHNVTSTGSPNFSSSGNQDAGSFMRTFNAIGTYQYECSLHSQMTGRIVVR